MTKAERVARWEKRGIWSVLLVGVSFSTAATLSILGLVWPSDSVVLVLLCFSWLGIILANYCAVKARYNATDGNGHPNGGLFG